MMVAKRAKQLIAGAKPLIKTNSKSQVAIALKELEAGKFFIKKREDPEKEDLFKRIFRFRSKEEDQKLELKSEVWKGEGVL